MIQTLTLFFCLLFLLGGAVSKQAQVPANSIYQQDSTLVTLPDSTRVLQQDSTRVPFKSYPTIPPTEWKLSFWRLLNVFIRDLFCKCQCPHNKPSTSPAK
jgi:hypothetical protein